METQSAGFYHTISRIMSGGWGEHCGENIFAVFLLYPPCETHNASPMKTQSIGFYHSINRIMSGGWGEQVGECMWNSPAQKTLEEIDTLKVD